MKCIHPVQIRNQEPSDDRPNVYHTVPCGKCYYCLSRLAMSWSARLEKDEAQSTSSAFVTLTYSEDNLPKSNFGIPTLEHSDVQKYFKRIRKEYPDTKLRYMVAGEYGPLTQRPHYHIIAYTMPGYRGLPKSAFDKHWQLGHTTAYPVQGGGIGYTMKYMTKLDTKVDPDLRSPEKRWMSQGIGDTFLTPQIIDYYRENTDKLLMPVAKKYQISLPRYYGLKIFSEEEWSYHKRQIVNYMAIKEKEQKLLYYAQNEISNYKRFETYVYEQLKEKYKREVRYQHKKHRDCRASI